MLHVTLKNLWARKFRLFTTSMAIMLGVAFMAGALVLTSTLNKTFTDLFSDVFKNTDAVVRGQVAVESYQGSEAQRPPIDESLLSAVRAVPGVQSAEVEINGYAQLTDKNKKPIGDPEMGAPTFGAVWTEGESNPFVIASGKAPASNNEVVIDKASADKGKYVVGDNITILTQAAPTEYKIAGIARFGQVDSPAGASFALFTKDEAQQAMGRPGKVDAISVVASNGLSQEEIRSRIATVMPAGTEVVTGAEITKENQDALQEGISFFQYFLTAFGGIALFVGAFIINNTFSILLAQRQRENALLRAIGARRRQILASVMVEALVVGLIASVVGLFAGVGVAIGLKSLLGAFGLELPSGPIVITANAVIVSLVAGIGVSVLSAYLPARRGSKVPPIAAMRDVAIETSGRSVKRLITGLLVTGSGAGLISVGLFAKVDNAIIYVAAGAALTFIGVAILGPTIAVPVARVIGKPLPRLKGISGVLARENALRNPKRTARTASALMIGVALVTFISVFGASAKASINDAIDKAFTGDFVIRGPFVPDGGLSPQMAADLKKLPEVKEASPIRASSAQVDGKTVGVAGIEPQSFSSIFDVGVGQGNLNDLGAAQIAIKAETAKGKNWSVGDRVPIQFIEGGPQEFTLVATYEDKNEIIGPYTIGLDAWNTNIRPAYDMLVMVAAADGVSIEQAHVAIEKVTLAYPTAKVEDNSQYKESVGGQIDQILNLVSVLLALAVIIALLGIANTLALSIFERTRELGLLRAVGMSRRQLRSSIRWESAIMALLGAVQGLVIGIFLGWAMQQALKDEGIRIFAVPFGFVIILTVVAAIAGILAALWPARRAARLNILDAIATT